MNKQSFAAKIKDSENILAGVKQHQAELIQKGYTTEKFIKGYEERLKDSIEMKNTREKKKVEMINMTGQLHQKMDELNTDRQTLKDIVRRYVPKSEWESFGMTYQQRKSKSGSEPMPIPDKGSRQ